MQHNMQKRWLTYRRNIMKDCGGRPDKAMSVLVEFGQHFLFLSPP